MPVEPAERWRVVAVVVLATLAGVCMVLGHIGAGSSDHAHAGMASPTEPASKHSLPLSSDDHCDASSAARCTVRIGSELGGLVILAVALRRVRSLARPAGAGVSTPMAHLVARVVVPQQLVVAGGVGLLCVSRT